MIGPSQMQVCPFSLNNNRYTIIVTNVLGDDWFNAFSLKKNFKTLFNVTKSQSDIPTLHGIRFLNAILLLFAHKSMALFFNPYVNRTEMSEVSLITVKLCSTLI